MINQEISVLNDIANIIYNSTSKEFDTAHLEYKFNNEENWKSISYWYTKKGKKFCL